MLADSAREPPVAMAYGRVQLATLGSSLGKSGDRISGVQANQEWRCSKLRRFLADPKPIKREAGGPGA